MSASILTICPDSCCAEAFVSVCGDAECIGYGECCYECADAFEYEHSLCVWE